LNCDEQYLPGALRRVSDFFAAHPRIEVVFGDVIMVNPAGEYLWHRKMQTPQLYHTWTCHLSTLSCAMWFRRELLSERDFWLNPAWRDCGDGEWMVRLLRAGVRMATLGAFTSTFTQTGQNMSAGPNARAEALRLRQTAPAWARVLRPALIAQHRLRRWLGGSYRQAPFAYEIYSRSSGAKRERHEVAEPRAVSGEPGPS
jgi:hypothetical protein